MQNYKKETTIKKHHFKINVIKIKKLQSNGTSVGGKR